MMKKKIPSPNPTKFFPESMFREKLPHNVSTNENDNTEDNSDDEEIRNKIEF